MSKLSFIKNYLSKIKDYIINIKNNYFDNHRLVTDILTKLIITFGVVLIVGGLYLMMTDPSSSSQMVQTKTAIQSTVSIVNWVPGIPFYVGDMANCSATTIGLVSWMMGVDLLIVGLGLWTRNKFARLIAVIIFLVAASFQFLEFILIGFLGSPSSLFNLFVDIIFTYFLLTRFEKLQLPKKII